MAMVLELTSMGGIQLSKKFTIKGRVSKIGSAAQSDLLLQERQIELHHAEVHQILDRFFVVPLTPQNRGISLNGMPVYGRSRLNPGDILTLGATSYRVAVTEQLEKELGGSAGRRHDVPPIGEYFVRRGLMNQEQIARTMRRQSELEQTSHHVAFGQLAYELGFVNRSQLDAALSEQRSDFNERFKD
ncbi:MAG: FHA domain-containing protein [Roseiflexaceae bacterium]|nr:FHA domain-containing protein [Roseiflexaceae bacterium]